MSISVFNSKFAILIGISVLPCPCYFANLQSKRYYWGGVVALPIKQHTPLFSQPVWSSFLSNYYRIKIAFDNSEIRQRKVDIRSKWSNKCSIMFFSGAQLTWVWKTSYTHSDNRFIGGVSDQPARQKARLCCDKNCESKGICIFSNYKSRVGISYFRRSFFFWQFAVQQMRFLFKIGLSAPFCLFSSSVTPLGASYVGLWGWSGVTSVTAVGAIYWSSDRNAGKSELHKSRLTTWAMNLLHPLGMGSK